MVHLVQPAVRAVQAACLALGKTHGREDGVAFRALILAQFDQGIVVRQNFLVLFQCVVCLGAARVGLHFCRLHIQHVGVIRQLFKAAQCLGVAGCGGFVLSEECAQTGAGVVDLDLQRFQHLFRDVRDLFHVHLVQCRRCRLVVAQRIFVVRGQLVHLSTPNVSFCLCIRLVLGLFDGRGVVCLCIVILLQAGVRLCTAHVSRDVLRVEADGFRKGRHSFGVVLFSQVFLAEFHLFHCLLCF